MKALSHTERSVNTVNNPQEDAVPERIQRSRAKGWRMPENAVYVGRPTKWGNPWRVGEPSPWAPYEPMDHAQAVAVFRYGIDTDYGRATVRRELAGRDLACWCRLEDEHGNRVPCHADVLLELAADTTGESQS